MNKDFWLNKDFWRYVAGTLFTLAFISIVVALIISSGDKSAALVTITIVMTGALILIAILPQVTEFAIGPQGVKAKLVKLENAVREQEEKVENLTSKVKQIEEKITFEFSPALTPDLEQELNAALLDFSAYMQNLGFNPQEGEVKVRIQSDLRGRAFYDPYTHKIVIAEDLFSKKDAALYQYTYHALLPAGIEDIADISATYLEIEAGLALYFVCSFNNSPLFLPKLVQASSKQRDKWDLSRLKKFQKVQPSGGFRDHDLWQAPWIETFEGDFWAAAFWQIRTLVDQDRADKLLFATWSDLQLNDFHSNNRVDFAKRLLKIAPSYESGEHVSQIQAIFELCGLKF